MLLTSLFLCQLVIAQVSDEPATIDLKEAIVVAPGIRGGRTPIRQDPIAAQIASGKWSTPKAGDHLTIANKPGPEWKSVTAVDDGTFRDQAMRGGYASVTVPSKSDRVMILEAVGHDMVYAGGSPRAGDPYGHGYLHLPVALSKGDNELLFSVGRGSLKARLTTPKAPTYLDFADATMPEVLSDLEIDAWAGVIVVNATNSPAEGLKLIASIGGQNREATVPFIPPLTTRKVPVKLVGPAPSKVSSVDVKLTLMNGDKRLDEGVVKLTVRSPEDTRNITFLSGIDGSVQYYGHVPAQRDSVSASRKPGLIFTLHGAGVEGAGQARVYAPKAGIHVVAPTNRRPYGFDWEDWGRLDALEVLTLAQKQFDIDSRRTYLTGHSMGGHGTWHLGVTYPDRFAAIAPSAGWVSMFSYAGMQKSQNPSPIDEIVQRSATGSDTLSLASNLKGLGVYILHGDADDNVPVSQAREMRRALSEFHPDYSYYERPGAGHWWGNECCDWPPLIEFLTSHERPSDVRHLDFVTASPGISASRDWVVIEAQKKSMRTSKIQLKYDPAKHKLSGTTENVTRLTLNLPDDHLDVSLDDSAVVTLAPNNSNAYQLARDGETWKAAGELASTAKTPIRCGPFKTAFRNRMIFVYGTKGTVEENAWALAKARYDAETFAYRGNGSVDIVADVNFDPKSEPDRNVILYGNADTNTAWTELLKASPLQVSRGKFKLGKREISDDSIACLFLQPRPGSQVTSVGVVTGTGLTGMRSTDRLPYFSSGVAYPDMFVMGADGSEKSTPAVLCAGFFGPEWGLEGAEIVWQ